MGHVNSGAPPAPVPPWLTGLFQVGKGAGGRKACLAQIVSDKDIVFGGFRVTAIDARENVTSLRTKLQVELADMLVDAVVQAVVTDTANQCIQIKMFRVRWSVLQKKLSNGISLCFI